MPLDTTAPFTRAEALAAGISRFELAGPRFQRLFHGLYLSATVAPTALMRARAALRISPAGSYVSHQTAGELRGAYMPGYDRHPSRYRRRTPAPSAGGSSRTGRTRPYGRCAFAASWSAKVPIHPRNRGSGCSSCWPGCRNRKSNRILPGPNGEWSRRLDLCYDELTLVIEYDGRQHLRNPQQWSADLLRRGELERQGWRFVVITAEALYGDPAGTLARIFQALRDRGCPQLRRTLATQWRRHFSGHSAAA